jgi:hypothetical protein
MRAIYENYSLQLRTCYLFSFDLYMKQIEEMVVIEFLRLL